MHPHQQRGESGGVCPFHLPAHTPCRSPVPTLSLVVKPVGPPQNSPRAFAQAVLAAWNALLLPGHLCGSFLTFPELYDMSGFSPSLYLTLRNTQTHTHTHTHQPLVHHRTDFFLVFFMSGSFTAVSPHLDQCLTHSWCPKRDVWGLPLWSSG